MKQVILSLLAVVTVLFPRYMSAATFTYEYEGKKVIYEIVDADAKTCITRPGYYLNNTILYAGNRGMSGDIILPAHPEYKGESYTLIGIGNRSFYSNNANQMSNDISNRLLTSVTIPETVTYIGDYAFETCTGLENVTISGDNLTSIGQSAFERCSHLKSINLPNSITSIGQSAFLANFRLEAINIPENLEEISPSAFQQCTTLTTVNIPNSVKVIGKYAFTGCSSLATLTWGNSVTTIGSSAFGSTKLKSISLPNSVTDLDCAFFDCKDLESLIISSGVTTIPGWFLDGCTGLKSLTIPAGVTTFSSVSFNRAANLETVVYMATKPIRTSSIFEDNVYDNATLYASSAAKEDISSRECWSRFKKVIYGDMSLNHDNASISEGETLELSAEVTFEDLDKTVTWTSSDEKVAAVDANGIVRAVAPGSATITATIPLGIQANCDVTVAKPTVLPESITLDSEEISIEIGKTATLTATVSPDDTSDKTIEWTSSDDTVATVNEEGVVEGISKGTAIITAATSNGIKAECKVTVSESISTGIEALYMDGASLTSDDEVRVYDLAGRLITVTSGDKLDSLQSGVFILVVRGKKSGIIRIE